jgi:cysteine desulfurase/selenocysteine lyase
VQDLDADFFTFSGHKMFAPTGSGVLYGKREWLDKMPPYQTGGGMIRTVSFEKTTFAPIPEKFEAGTPAIAANIGLGAAIDYLNSIDFAKPRALRTRACWNTRPKNYRNRRRPHHRHGARKSVGSVVHHRKRSPARHRHDFRPIGHRHPRRTSLRAARDAVFQVPATARASFAFYNTREEVDVLADAIQK